MDLYCTPRSQVMHQAREISPLTFPLPDGHSQGVQGQVGAHWPTGGLPADDPPREDVGYESHIDPPREGAYIGDVGDPQPTRGEGLEVAPDQVGRALLPRRAARGARGPGASDAAQAQVAHEPHGRCSGPRDRHRDARRSQVGSASHVSCGSPAPSSWFLWTLDISALRASSRRPLALGVVGHEVVVMGRWGQRGLGCQDGWY